MGICFPDNEEKTSLGGIKMESLKELYKVGNGPSSSHTMGPQRAAEQFKNKYPEAASYKAHLYGSLAATGEG